MMPMAPSGPALVMRPNVPPPAPRKQHLHWYGDDVPTSSSVAMVTPLCVFAAGRSRFDVVVRWNGPLFETLHKVFKALPLAANGWIEGETRICKVGTARDGFPIWRMERT